jgi:hypothetical protein
VGFDAHTLHTAIEIPGESVKGDCVERARSAHKAALGLYLIVTRTALVGSPPRCGAFLWSELAL